MVNAINKISAAVKATELFRKNLVCPKMLIGGSVTYPKSYESQIDSNHHPQAAK